MKFKKLAFAVASIAVAGAMAVGASAETAGLMMKTSNWAHRNNLNQSNAMCAIGEDGDMEVVAGWSVSDVEITSNGQFMCSYKHEEMTDAKDGVDSFWYALKLDTNIVAADYPDVTITLDHLYVDGKELTVPKNTAAEGEAANGYNVAIQKPERSDYDDAEVVEMTVDYYSIEFYNNWSDNKWISGSNDFGREVVCIFTVDGFKEPEDGNLPVVDYTPTPPETNAPETDAPETDAPKTDAPETDATDNAATSTNAPVTTAASSSSSSSNDGGWVIWVVIAAVVVVVVVVAVVIIKKKK